MCAMMQKLRMRAWGVATAVNGIEARWVVRGARPAERLPAAAEERGRPASRASGQPWYPARQRDLAPLGSSKRLPKQTPFCRHREKGTRRRGKVISTFRARTRWAVAAAGAALLVAACGGSSTSSGGTTFKGTKNLGLSIAITG